MIETSATRLSNIDIHLLLEFFIDHYKFNEKECVVLFEGLGGNASIADLAPSKIISRYIDDLKLKHRFPSKIFYPFVFPSKEMWSSAHIVLIYVDLRKSLVGYYDSLGLSPDDPIRLHIFEDNPEFNMYNDLQNLADSLPKKIEGDAPQYYENRIVHQTDPFNCGIFVSKVIQLLATEEISFEDLIIKQWDGPIYSCRKELTLKYIDRCIDKILLKGEKQ